MLKLIYFVLISVISAFCHQKKQLYIYIFWIALRDVKTDVFCSYQCNSAFCQQQKEQYTYIYIYRVKILKIKIKKTIKRKAEEENLISRIMRNVFFMTSDSSVKLVLKNWAIFSPQFKFSVFAPYFAGC